MPKHVPSTSLPAQADMQDPDLGDIDVGDADTGAEIVNSLTTAAIQHARQTIQAMNSYSGTIDQARESLMGAGIHPQVSDPSTLTTPLIPQEEAQISVDPEAQEELIAAPANAADDNVDVILDNPTDAATDGWDIEDPLDPQEQEDFALDGRDQTQEVETRHVDATQDQQYYYNDQQDQGWERVLTTHLGTLYDGLKAAFDQVLADNHEIKSILAQHQSDVRMIRDEQVRLFSAISDTRSQLTAMQSVSAANQYDLSEIKEELSICTAGFSKINSALLQMNSISIPIGKLPTTTGYQSSVSAPSTSAGVGGKTTPIAYGDEQLAENLKRAHFPSDKIPIICALLNNRTVKSFSCLLPQLNSKATVSHDAARQLIEMPLIQNKEDLLKACKAISELLNLRVGDQDRIEAPIVPIPADNISREAATLVKSSRIKKNANPFAK